MEIDPLNDSLLYGVERLLMTWSFQTCSYTADYDAREVVGVLAAYAHGTIGLVGFAQMPYALVSHVKEALPAGSGHRRG